MGDDDAARASEESRGGTKRGRAREESDRTKSSPGGDARAARGTTTTTRGGASWDSSEFEVEVDGARDASTSASGSPGPGSTRSAGGSDGGIGDDGGVGERPRKVDYYDILGVPFDSSEQRIRSAYLKAALRNHPDKHGDTEEAKRRFQEIGEAYHVLSDPERRAEYDQAAEYAIDDFGVEEYLLRFRIFVLTSQGLSLGAQTGEEEDVDVQEEIAQFLGFSSSRV
jgi:DnaJ-domain-containing protein 1